jgi:putative ABC transport system substrate-binding protein
MRRREFITLLGGAAAWPLGANTQQRAAPVVGFLSSRSPRESDGVVNAFLQGLQETGYTKGQNVALMFRWAHGAYERLPELAVELVDLRVSVLLAAGGAPSALAAKAATSNIPVVFSAVHDPDRLGLVASYNRPGSNVTGMSIFTAGIGAKSVELLPQIVPATSTFAYLVNPSNPIEERYLTETATAARILGVQLHMLKASTEDELDKAFAALVALGAGALVVPGEAFFDSKRDKIVALATKSFVPTIYAFREYVTAGGLMSYGSRITDCYRRAGIYVGRILKGENPADLPVMQPTTFEFVINRKTANALRLNIPPTLLALADEVIE